MPYDPTPSAQGAPGPDGQRDTLTVQLQGGPAADGTPEPETVLVLGRPVHGHVPVREFPSPGAPAAYDARVDDVRARIEAVARAGRRVSAELYHVRQWLDGRA